MGVLYEWGNMRTQCQIWDDGAIQFHGDGHGTLRTAPEEAVKMMAALADAHNLEPAYQYGLESRTGRVYGWWGTRGEAANHRGKIANSRVVPTDTEIVKRLVVNVPYCSKCTEDD